MATQKEIKYALDRLLFVKRDMDDICQAWPFLYNESKVVMNAVNMIRSEANKAIEFLQSKTKSSG